MSAQRLATIDSLRGVAIVWMTVFHFCFDLAYFGWSKQNLYVDPFWTWQRTAIVSLFLFCAGLGQATAVAQSQSWNRFWKRWAQIAGCSLLVTAGSYLMFPKSFIYFGVLHGIALMLIVVRLTAGSTVSAAPITGPGVLGIATVANAGWSLSQRSSTERTIPVPVMNQN